MPGRRFSIRYWPDASVNAVRTFSISSGLAASTVTPGSTAPEASWTVPVIVACAYRAEGKSSTREIVTKVPRKPRMSRLLSAGTSLKGTGPLVRVRGRRFRWPTLDACGPACQEERLCRREGRAAYRGIPSTHAPNTPLIVLIVLGLNPWFLTLMQGRFVRCAHMCEYDSRT